MGLSSELKDWDGKSADQISMIFDRYNTDPDFLNAITDLLQVTSLQSGASWLLKRYLELGAAICASKVSFVYERLDGGMHWEARLHLLQSMDYMPITDADRDRVNRFLRLQITDKNKFVRAWSYNGLYLLAKQHAQYQDEVAEMLAKAMLDEAASVKSRIRNLLKKGF